MSADGDHDSAAPAKKIKANDELSMIEKSQNHQAKETCDDQHLPPLDQFSLIEVLANDIDRKSAFLHLRKQPDEGNGGIETDMVIILDKKPFCDDDFQAVTDSDRTTIRQLMRNDIYGGYEIELPPRNNALKSTIIYPATEKHVDKYRRVESVMVAETSEDYERVTLPHVTQSQFSTQWVQNVLDGKAEKERVFYRDDDFILAPDLKWDGHRLENLYVTAIARRGGIKSIRDLTTEHLPLLKKILDNGVEAIISKYKIQADQLRIFLHYQPSYYHLHVHFVHLMNEAPGTTAGKAHLLADVIENIELKSDYYQRKTMYYTLKKNDPLLEKLRGRKEK